MFYVCVWKQSNFFTFLLQPAQLTIALEISNLVFTALFGLEMLLKLLAYGVFGYIKNGFNLFDGFIVIIRYTQFGV